MADPYLLSLAEEYVSYVDAMRSGSYTTEEIRQLDSQRQLTHNELRRHTGLDPDDMYAYCRNLLWVARK
jgi:hypothetical protein